MDKHTLLNLIDEPQRISENDLERLEEIATTYPYFQLTHLLIAKYTQDKESMLAPQKIRRAASYAYDRNQLRKLIESPAKNENNGGDIKLKTHFESVDSDAPRMISAFEQVDENLAGLHIDQNKEQEDQTSASFFDVVIEEQEENLEDNPEDNLNDTAPAEDIPREESKIDDIQDEGTEDSAENNSFFDEISPDESVESIEKEKLENTDTEDISEAKALGLFHDGDTDGAEQMFKQLVLQHPQKAAYYYKQLEILTDKPEYAQLAKEHEPQEEKQASPFFENIPDSSLSETEILISQASESISESESFFEGIGEDDENTLKNTDEHPEEENSTQIEEYTEVKENTPNSFFDTLNTEEDEEEQTEYHPEQIISKPDTAHPNQITENEKDFFLELAAVEDIHTIERSADSEQNPFEDLNRKRADVSETEEPFEFKPEPKPDSQLFSAGKNENEPPARYMATLSEDISEPKAIHFFNQGRNKEAIEIYEQLLERNPQKASYYLSQINVIKNQEEEPKKGLKQSPKILTEKPKIEYQPEQQKDEELNERLAIQLFNDGKLEEAVAIYTKLRDRETQLDKKAYYEQQIGILKS